MYLSDKKARDKVKQWGKVLGLDPAWDTTTVVNNFPDADLDDPHKESAAFIEVDEAYIRIRITINAYQIDPEELDQTVAHELVHVVLSPLATVIRCNYGERFESITTNLVERATETIAKALLRLHTRKRNPNTKAHKGKR